MSAARRLLKISNRLVESALRTMPRPHPHAVEPPPTATRVLMVKLVGMGDAVLMRSVIAHLQRRRPELTIGVLAGPATRPVLGTIHRVRVHSFDPGGADATPGRFLAKIRELRREAYDVVIDFEQHLVLVAAFLSLTGIANRIGLAADGSPRSRFQTMTVPLSGRDSMWDAYCALARTIEPALQCESALPLPVPAPAIEWVNQWWQQHRLAQPWRTVALHVGCGSSAVARRWPIARFARLAELLHERAGVDRFVLTGTRAELPLAAEFARGCRLTAVAAMDLPSITHTAELLRRCALLVSNDTGVMHLAAAMGTPTVGLFGPNSPERYAPVGPSAQAVYRTTLRCSPCIHIHRGVVPGCSHSRSGQCLHDIEPDYVASLATRLLREDEGRRLA